MEELVTNLHIHTTYSDGTWLHRSIAETAIQAGLDAIIITDHNVLVRDIEGYHQSQSKKVMMIVGEEIHDKLREPQKSHLITFGQSIELCTYAADPQLLIKKVTDNGGLSFLAHPFENPLPQVNEVDITWEDWNIVGFTGIEIWNHLSELKNESKNWLQLLFNVFLPSQYAKGPHPLAVRKWDDLLSTGKKFVAVGGSDAHSLEMKKGIFKRSIFPYLFHFQSINNHLIVPNRLTGNFLMDKKVIIEAFRSGNSFIGYDLPAPTRGFRFYAQGKNGTAIMGDEISLENSVTLQIRLPEPVECRLIHNKKIIQTWYDQDICTYITKQPGFYRVECYMNYWGRKRAWIFSNPIYVR